MNFGVRGEGEAEDGAERKRYMYQPRRLERIACVRNADITYHSSINC